MNQLEKKRMDLLKQEIEIVQIEELLEKSGDLFELRSVKAERDMLHQERMSIEKRLAFKVVAG